MVAISSRVRWVNAALIKINQADTLDSDTFLAQCILGKYFLSVSTKQTNETRGVECCIQESDLRLT